MNAPCTPRLAPEAKAAGFRLEALDTTASTNGEALERAEAGDQGRLWVIAREQTKGRGRHGRTWWSPPGNLYASLLLIGPCDPQIAPQLAFVSGLAVHDAVASLTGMTAPSLSLKWPNDLLLDGAKLVGILLEGHQLQSSGAFAVIIGIGINLASAPGGTHYPTVSLAQAFGPVTVAAMMAHLSGAVSKRLAEWNSGRGFEPIKDAWLARGNGVGGPVTVRLPAREVSGTFAGLDAAGRLIVETERGREIVDAGDVFFGSNDPAAGRE